MIINYRKVVQITLIYSQNLKYLKYFEYFMVVKEDNLNNSEMFRVSTLNPF